MATKWKNKWLMVVWTFALTIGLSGIAGSILHGSDYLHRDYFHTPRFQQEVTDFVHYLALFDFVDMSMEEAKGAITVSADEIDEHRYRFGNLEDQIQSIRDQYSERIETALANDMQEAADTLMAERDEKIQDITTNFTSDEHVREKIRQDKEQQVEEFYMERERFRSTFQNYVGQFQYYFTNNQTGRVYTNLSLSDGKTAAEYLSNDKMFYVNDYHIYPDDYFHYLLQVDYEVWQLIRPEGWVQGQVGVPKSLSSNAMFMGLNENFKQEQRIAGLALLASLLALLFSAFVGKKLNRRMNEDWGLWQSYYTKIPVDIRLGLLGGTGIMAIAAFSILVANLFLLIRNPIDNMVFIGFFVVASSALLGLTILQIRFLWVEFRRMAAWKEAWGKSLVVLVWKKLKEPVERGKQLLLEAFLNQSTGTQFFLLLAGVFALGLGAITFAMHPFLVLLYLVFTFAVGLPLLVFLMKKIGYFNRIVVAVDEMASGKLGEDLPVEGKDVLGKLADQINQLKHGVKVSQSEKAKSERLKTELITNVSHDLRTPLTSIITYTELLKGDHVADEERRGYLEIIDRKSKRLKVLIDDLFEVSKMASGNIELNRSKVDLVQLLQQTLGEYDDTIKASSLQFRVSQPSEPVYAQVDGQKLWRVFENLIGNILKYSLEYSRVYITIKPVDGKGLVEITFKNVSKYELDGGSNNGELVERFKRGDQSRHTDGSGLGLAIAQSIVDLHGGTLEIETDADLFKVTIKLEA